MKILLIDDEALNGWQEVLETVLFKGSKIQASVSEQSAHEQLSANEFDLILLDLRFGEKDHAQTKISEFGGYKILTNYIRSSFSSINFPSPVVLFTASNKAWNIFEMIENGIDSFYIKEHPDFANDVDFSRQNYLRLKAEIPRVIELGEKRRRVWTKIQKIICGSQSTIFNSNIRERIEDKLKIGYALLFRKTTKVEYSKLLFNNEINSFVVFWSILEEIAKDSFKDNWIRAGEREGQMLNNTWILRNGRSFIEDLRFENAGETTGVIKVHIEKQGGQYIVKEKTINCDSKDVSFYEGKISLSLQVHAVLLLQKNWSPSKVASRFKRLNAYRNEIDFIHSSLTSIFTNKLSDLQDSNDAFEHCILMLDFLNEIMGE